MVRGSADLLPVLVVGLPLVHGTRVLNCAVVIHRGRVLGVAAKSYLPTYREFYERRHFAPGDDRRGATIEVCGAEVPFGPDLIFAATDLPDLKLHVEICEDMWVPVPPSAEASLAGATVLANLSGSPITVARAEDRRLLVRSASARCNAAYVFAAAGQGESTTDLSWDGQTMVYECGELLAEGRAVPRGAASARSPTSTSTGSARTGCGRAPTTTTGAPTPTRVGGVPHRSSSSSTPPTGDIGLRRKVDRFPFVPDDPSGSRSTATRPTTSRSPGSSSGCTRHRRSPRRSSASAAASTRRTR